MLYFRTRLLVIINIFAGRLCERRILRIPQKALTERMLQEPFWLGLITVFVVLGCIGLFWCAKRHVPEKLEKLLAEEADRNRTSACPRQRHHVITWFLGTEAAEQNSIKIFLNTLKETQRAAILFSVSLSCSNIIWPFSKVNNYYKCFCSVKYRLPSILCCVEI